MSEFKKLNGYDVKDNQAREDVSTIQSNVGDLSNLQTTDKSSLVNAINEVNGNVYVKDNYLVWSGTHDPDDPDSPIIESMELPEGWTNENTIVICCKERPHSAITQDGNNWQVRQLRWFTTQEQPIEEYDYRTAYIWLLYTNFDNVEKYSVQYSNQYFEVGGEGTPVDWQITLMRIDLPEPNESVL